MLVSSIPYKFGEPWATGAASGYINTIPVTTSVTGAASQTLGFPPVTDTPSGAGGVPPSIKDFNGVLQYETAWSQCHQAGGPISYDSTFSTAIGGYPKGAFLLSSTGNFHWISTADNNTTNPDGGSPANWSQLYAVLAGSSSQQFNVANATSSANAVALGQFTSSRGASGWRKLPDGTIRQWGTVTITSSGSITFPITFPNAVFADSVSVVLQGAGSGGPTAPMYNASTITASGMTIYINTGFTNSLSYQVEGY